MKDEHKIQRQGKTYVLYAGLLEVAHAKGLREIDTFLHQIPSAENGNVAVVLATVVMDDDRKFTGIGDASPENVGRNIVPHLLRMAECFSLDAEILTRNGWRAHGELTVGEEVLAYDVEVDMLRWVELEAVNVFKSQPTVTWVGQSFRFTGTPNHKWPVEKAGQRKHAPQRVLRPANEFRRGDRLITGALAEGGYSTLSVRDAAVLGWLVTDGSLRFSYTKDKHGRYGPYPRAYIQQSKEEYIPEIRGLLRDDATEVVEAPRQGGIGITATRTAHRFSLKTPYLTRLLSVSGLRNTAAPFSCLTPLVLRMSSAARRAFLSAALHGDGTRKQSGSWVFGKKRKPGVMEAVELAAFMEGYSMGKPSFSSKGDVPIRTFKTSRTTGVDYIQTVPGPVQDVWCPTTPLGTCVVRQNGYIAPSGQTRAKARALRDAVNVSAAVEGDGDIEDETVNASAAVEEYVAVHDGKRYRAERKSGPRPVEVEDHPAPVGGEGQPPTGELPATKKQLNYLEGLVNEYADMDKFEKAIDKKFSELTREEASDWIGRLSGRAS